MLKCFIAMAFEKKDTDQLYGKTIAPLLKKKGIVPRRVDRIVHNDNIDVKIINELKKSDFAIADLTYARPSVYFEAGFAQCKYPVIYTCRKDHAVPKIDDKFGNLQVHFDLKMRNIIFWKHPTDNTFINKLSKRIDLVTRPLIKAERIKQCQQDDIDKFAMLSEDEKIQKSRIIGAENIIKFGYKDSLKYLDENALRHLRPGYLWAKLRKGVLHVAYLHIAPSTTRAIIGRLYSLLIREPSYLQNSYDLSSDGHIPNKFLSNNNSIRKIEEHIFWISFVGVSIARVMSELTEFRKIPDGKTLLWVKMDRIGSRKKQRKIYFHLIDGIKSERMLEESILKLLRNM